MEHIRTYAQVHLDNIEYNLNLIKTILRPETDVIAVVKANAYGHGANIVSKHIENSVAAFAVSNIVEAIKLRIAGLKKPILILGYTPPTSAIFLSRYDLIQTVYGENFCLALDREAKKVGVRVQAHMKIDTGMSRIGFAANDRKAQLRAIDSECIDFSGIYTHFSSADGKAPNDKSYTLKQYEAFMSVVKGLESCGVSFQKVHCCNSAASMKYTEMQCDCIRFGISLYGMTPDNSNECTLPLKEAMTLKTVAAYVKECNEGVAVSYGRTHVLAHKTKLATVAMGYADGYPRLLSNKGVMYCKGKQARVVGRVCMDQIVLECEDINEGDEIDVFGYGVKQSISDFARMAETINYEVTCNISARVPRVYMIDGKEVYFSDTTP